MTKHRNSKRPAPARGSTGGPAGRRAQHPLQHALDDSPPMRRQRERIDASFGQALQRQELDDEEPLQDRLEATAQRQAETRPAADRGGMPASLMQGIESLSGMDLSAVRVHYNSARPAQLNAHAFAQGDDIHLGAGQEKHLPHEAWHVVQQRQGRVQPTMELGGEKINDDAALEAEADVMGDKARQFEK